MKKVTKKKKTKTKSKTRARKPKHYSAHYLVILLAILIPVESFFAFNSTAADWKNGFALLDVSSSVSETVSDVAFLAQPLTTAVTAVNGFYSQATIAATQLLAPTDNTDLTIFVTGVNQFYSQAADQMVSVLDLSRYNSWNAPNPPEIAGAAIYK